MKLPPALANEFIRLHTEIILFAGKESGKLPAKMTAKELMGRGPDFLIEHRNRIYDNPAVLDRYAAAKGSVSDQLKEDIKGFKNFVRSSFYIMKHYANYTVLMDDDQLYGIVGLTQGIDEIVPEWALPAMVETVLLPFRGHYIYDGLMMGSNISFGRGISASMNDDFKRIKAINGILVSPEQRKKSGSLPKNKEAEAERELRYLMNSRKRWDEEYDTIGELRNKYPALDHVFYECASKLLAKRHKKDLREIGVSNRYYAVYYNSVLASAPTHKALMKELDSITFNGRVEDCAVFKV